MKQGAEFLDTSDAAWARWAALSPDCMKVRFGVFFRADYVHAIATMEHFTTKPLILLRPRTEVPDVLDLRLRLTEELDKIPYGAEVWLEPGNEPNQTETRKGLGGTTAEQVATYRRLLWEWAALLRAEFGWLKIIAPGLMPEGDGMAAWMVEERSLYDFDGCHIYGGGLSGLMLPARFYAPPVITEIGSKESNRQQAVTAIMQWLADNFDIQALVHFAVPEWSGPDGTYIVTEANAQVYNTWHKDFHKEEPMPYDRHDLFDGWYKRLGGPGYNPNIVFGEFVATNTGVILGPAIGPVRGEEGGPEADWPIYAQEFATGILWVRKSAVVVANVHVARSEGELPLG